jgi:transcriptional regulator with XRE-family HTH domain
MTEQTKGQRIAEVRKQIGMTQRQFCKVLSITQPSLASIETGKANPSDTLVKFVEMIASCQPANEWFTINVLPHKGNG